MKEIRRKKFDDPAVADTADYRVTDVMTAETYDERLLREMEETISAVMLSEAYPQTKSYEVPQDTQHIREAKDENEEK